jgi:hypothetical protein
MSKYRKGEFHSATEADSYMNQIEQSWRQEYYAAWKRIGPYFYFFWWMSASIALGTYESPTQYIMRTGDSIWQAFEIPEEIRKTMYNQLNRRGSGG